MILVPFLVAVASVTVFSFFAWLATHFRKRAWSRLLMWAGLAGFLAGCYFFGVTVYALKPGWMIAEIAFFTVSFGLSAAYFISKGRRKS